MSKLIIDMEMPKSCPCDLIGVGYDMYCSATNGIPKRVAEYDECVKNGTKPDWCPIKGVLPEEHGDLIDRQDTIKEFEPYAQYESNRTNAEWVERIKAVLNSMTTVIVKERKDDETN